MWQIPFDFRYSEPVAAPGALSRAQQTHEDGDLAAGLLALAERGQDEMFDADT